MNINIEEIRKEDQIGHLNEQDKDFDEFLDRTVSEKDAEMLRGKEKEIKERLKDAIFSEDQKDRK